MSQAARLSFLTRPGSIDDSISVRTTNKTGPFVKALTEPEDCRYQQRSMQHFLVSSSVQ